MTIHFLPFAAGFTWKELLLGGENWGFLPETMLRTLIMFIVIFVSLRLLGKRGVKQLSIFELVVIISLGSAAGDPMFYKEVGILPAFIVFVMIVGLYSLIVYFIGKHKGFENLVEGKPICLIQNGSFSIDNFSKEALGADEFFAELRIKGISQLGQVEQAIEESSGEISVFFYADDEVKPGLPILPDSLKDWQQPITVTDYYACIFCGYTKELSPTPLAICPACQKNKWVKASHKKRIT